MQLSGVREIGSNVLKNTRETSLWEYLSSDWPVGHRLHERKNCGRANQTSSPPVMSKSVNGSKSSKGSIRKGYCATRHKVSCHSSSQKRWSTQNIVYDIVYNIIYDVVYDVAYDMLCGMPLAKSGQSPWAIPVHRIQYRIRYSI
jgi:hypothetical protein